MRTYDRRSGLRARLLIAALAMVFGHVAAVGVVLAGALWSTAPDRIALQWIAGGLCAVLAILHFTRRRQRSPAAGAGYAGLAFWTFMASTAHGAGLALVPALMPLCLGDASAIAAAPWPA